MEENLTKEELNSIVKQTDLPTGNPDDFMKEFYFLKNHNPENVSGDGWRLLRVLKTETQNVPWLIEVNGTYYVGVWANQRRNGSYGVAFYPSDESGKYEISLNNLVYRSNNYMQMGPACNEFVKNC